MSLRTLFKLVDSPPGARQGRHPRRAARRPPPSRMYGLAGYFLISNGRDALGNNPAGTPEDWWSGYDTDLGDALGPRFDLAQRRHPARLHGRHRAAEHARQAGARPSPGCGLQGSDGVERTSVTLGPGTGIVLPAHRRAGRPRRPDRRRSTRPSPPVAPVPPASTLRGKKHRARPTARVSPRGPQGPRLGPRRRRDLRLGAARRPAQDGPQVEDGA